MLILAAAESFPWSYVLLGGAVAAVVRFVWNAICWMGLHHHKADFKSFGREPTELETALVNANPTPGYFYNLPHFVDYERGMTDPALAERVAKGPNGLYVPYPSKDCMGPKTFVHGFLLNLVEGVTLAVLSLILWSNTALPVEGILCTVLTFAGVGLFVAAAVHMAHSIWMMLPWGHTRHSMFDVAVGYAMMGATLYGMHSLLG